MLHEKNKKQKNTENKMITQMAPSVSLTFETFTGVKNATFYDVRIDLYQKLFSKG